MTYLPLQKHGGIASTTGVLQLIIINSSEGTDKEGGVGTALNVRECFDIVELGAGRIKVESLWVRIKGKANKAYILVGVCYRPPS